MDSEHIDEQQLEVKSVEFNQFMSGQFVFLQLLQHCLDPYVGKQPKSSCLQGEKFHLLKCIYIFRNEGIPESGIPMHWHYIEFGLSDIFGYKVKSHILRWLNKITKDEYFPRVDDLSMNGFEFELTFRLKCEPDEDEPPTWPSKIMQEIAEYVFRTRNTCNAGDHIVLYKPLDSNNGASRIQHLLISDDPQLETFSSDFITRIQIPNFEIKPKLPDHLDFRIGQVRFLQIVGVCKEELEVARQWKVQGVLDIMREHSETGGRYLVTDIHRSKTMFEISPETCHHVATNIQSSGSSLVLLTGEHKTSEFKPNWFIYVEKFQDQVNNGMETESSTTVDIDVESEYPIRAPSQLSNGRESALKVENIGREETRFYKSIYILMSEKSARYLPVMLMGRLAHKRPFTFQSFRGDSFIYFTPEGCQIPSSANQNEPFAENGPLLHIFVSNELRDRMWESIKEDFADEHNGSAKPLRLPKNYSWPEFNLYLTVVKRL